MITANEYSRNVAARASTAWHNEKIDKEDLRECLAEFINAGNRLDRAKKALMYGRDYEHELGDDLPIETPMDAIDEQAQVIAHSVLGVATEGVELIEALFAYLFKDQPFDLVNLQEEFGDVAWYRELGLQTVGQTHFQNLDQNERKLTRRLGPVSVGFTYKAANERDLAAERKELES